MAANEFFHFWFLIVEELKISKLVNKHAFAKVKNCTMRNHLLPELLIYRSANFQDANS